MVNGSFVPALEIVQAEIYPDKLLNHKGMMQLFKRLLNPISRSFWNSPIIHRNETQVSEQKTVLDLFQLDLTNLPLNDFTEGKMEVNANGDMIQTYFKVLDYKECGVFDTVQVKLTSNQCINIIFRSSEPSMVDHEKLRIVIDNLCDIYGHDANNQGLLTPSAEENTDQKFYVMFGRNWMDYPRYKYPVSVRRYSEDVFISVWGFKLSKIATGL